MEHLEGRDLGAIQLERGALPVDEVIEYSCQACEALAEAHDAGIIHRDLKPSNLFLATSPSGKKGIRVLDFGVAKDQKGEAKPGAFKLTTDGTILGTPRFMAPEQLMSEDTVDARSDIWGLGASMYRLVTGEYAFNGVNFGALTAAITSGPMPRAPSEIRPHVPPALSAAIMRCLSRDPARRFASMRELADALRAIPVTPVARGSSPSFHSPSASSPSLQADATQAAPPLTPTVVRPLVPTPVTPHSFPPTPRVVAPPPPRSSSPPYGAIAIVLALLLAAGVGIALLVVGLSRRSRPLAPSGEASSEPVIAVAPSSASPTLPATEDSSETPSPVGTPSTSATAASVASDAPQASPAAARAATPRKTTPRNTTSPPAASAPAAARSGKDGLYDRL
jgi:serine/threonine-protein kinase